MSIRISSDTRKRYPDDEGLPTEGQYYTQYTDLTEYLQAVNIIQREWSSCGW